MVSFLGLGKKALKVEGQHVYITGGSSGLGLAVACQLAARGAHITIVARRQPQLDAAVKDITSFCRSGQQKVNCISADLTDPQASKHALDQASSFTSASGKRVPDLIICAAGAAGNLLGLFAEDLTPQHMEKSMSLNYFSAAYTAMYAAKQMSAQHVHGKIVFVSSVAGMVPFAGYSMYTPAKAAIRALSDTLRNELLPYNISVHCYVPGNMLTPGFEEENKTKPQVCKDIEGPDEGITPELAAQRMIRGLEDGDYIITSDVIGRLFKAATSGVSPRGNFLSDALFRSIGYVGIPIWRMTADRQSKNSRASSS